MQGVHQASCLSRGVLIRPLADNMTKGYKFSAAVGVVTNSFCVLVLDASDY